jgi:hypothetical protein
MGEIKPEFPEKGRLHGKSTKWKARINGLA